jgi:lipoprotein-anchoring transpeptidase ErfK/SrfK
LLAYSWHRNRWARWIGIAVLVGLVYGSVLGVPSRAQATDNGSSGANVDDPAAANAGDPPAVVIAATMPRPFLKPPLPFESAQMGPAIKRAFGNDIEHRTRAFLPADLHKLTPTRIPQDEAKWIRVDLSEQIVVAYEGNRPIRAFVISSGLDRTPTVTGEFRIKTKVKSQTMTGGEGAYYYNLPNVKWVQYFYREYSFHGTYWHNDFGKQKSHGCLNMTNADAKWLFDWAGPKWDGKSAWFNSTKDNPGTLVIITK